VLSQHVPRALVVQAKVRDLETLHAFDQGVTELVKDHLRQAVIGVERARSADRHDTTPVGRGIDFWGSHDSEADARGDRQPDRVERIQVRMLWFSVHVDAAGDSRTRSRLASVRAAGDPSVRIRQRGSVGGEEPEATLSRGRPGCFGQHHK